MPCCRIPSKVNALSGLEYLFARMDGNGKEALVIATGKKVASIGLCPVGKRQGQMAHWKRERGLGYCSRKKVASVGLCPVGKRQGSWRFGNQ